MIDKQNGFGSAGLLVLTLVVLAAVVLSQTAPSEDETAQASPPAAKKDLPQQLKLNDDDISCTVTARKLFYVVGEEPQLEVRIQNNSRKKITLVGSLDASELGWRLPVCKFEVLGPPGHKGTGFGRCGNTNPLRPKDFVDVPAGGKFDPYMKVDDYGFFTGSNLMWNNFQVPGTYRITFHYETGPADLSKWNGIDPVKPDEKSEVERRLQQVPKVKTKSNTIQVTFGPPPGGFVPGFAIPISRAANQGSYYLGRVLVQGPIRPPQMDIVWMVDGLPESVSSDVFAQELSTLDQNNAYHVVPVQEAGGLWTHHFVSLGLTPEERGHCEFSKIARIHDALKAVNRKPQTREVLLEEIGQALSSYPLDPDDTDKSTVIFVITEKPLNLADIQALIPKGSDPAAVFRVTRKNGTWLPELLSGKVVR